jgi:hypothetical protein
VPTHLVRLSPNGIRLLSRQTLIPGLGPLKLRVPQGNGLRVTRLELDELWAYVGRRRRQHEKPIPGDPRGDQYTYVALASSTRAIIAYRTGSATAQLQTISFKTCASA